MAELNQDLIAAHRRRIVTTRWAEGASAGQISKELGCTRNVVSSIIHRLRLPKRSEQAREQQGKNNAAKQKGFAMPLVAGLGLSVLKAKKPPTFASKDGHPQPIGPIADFPAKLDTCRFIHGEVSSGSWQCCGLPGFPWCEFHEKRFTAPSTGKPNVDKAMLKASGILRALG